MDAARRPIVSKAAERGVAISSSMNVQTKMKVSIVNFLLFASSANAFRPTSPSVSISSGTMTLSSNRRRCDSHSTRHPRLRPRTLRPNDPSDLTTTTTSLAGKLWKRLQIEEDDPADGTAWYLVNCVAGVELDLLNQLRFVTADFPPNEVEKIVVPTSRHLRSHGKSRKVVDVRVRYPGYVFAKISLTEEVYETFQALELLRSWMGTVNRKGHTKLPPAPLPLNDDEVTKFKGLEEAQDVFEERFEGDYTGRNDKGADLMAQYAGYDVGQMVKILRGNFKDEDGTVRRLKDGQLCVRMFTYGQTFDEWFDPDAIRPLSDLEVMRGLDGPTGPIGQDQFNVDIGKKDPRELQDGGMGADAGAGSTGALRSGLLQGVSGFGGGQQDRYRREDRVTRGETGGQTGDGVKTEEENWLAYREERRDEQRGGADRDPDEYDPNADAAEAYGDATETWKKKKKDKGNDTWGIIERSSWSGGEYGFEADSKEEERAGMDRLAEKYRGRPVRRGRGGRGSERDGGGRGGGGRGDYGDRERRPRQDRGSEMDGGGRGGGGRDATRERRPVRRSRGDDRLDEALTGGNNEWASPSSRADDKDNDFFSSLMSELSEDLDDGVAGSSSDKSRVRGQRQHEDAGPSSSSRGQEERRGGGSDDFFANLMNELGGALDDGPRRVPSSSPSSSGPKKSSAPASDDDFFANLESELSNSLGGGDASSSASLAKQDDSNIDDDAFFDALESEIRTAKNRKEEPKNNKDGDFDFFASLENEMKEVLDSPPAQTTSQETSPEDDFFASLEREMEETVNAPPSSSSSGSVDGSKSPTEADDFDFFSGLIDEVAGDLESELSSSRSGSVVGDVGPNTEKAEAKRTQRSQEQSSAGRGGDLTSMTVPKLKDLLRSRGLKVGGKKAELIERLTTS